MAATLEEQIAQKALIERMQRSPDEVAAGYDPADPDAGFETSPISAAQMRGAAVTFTLGELELVLKPLKRRVLRDEFSPLLRSWPELIQFAAAVKKPRNPGIDVESVAFLITMFQAANHQREEKLRADRARKENQEFIAIKETDPVTIADVELMISSLANDFDSYVPAICDTIWLMAAGANPSLAWPRPKVPENDGDEAEEKTHNLEPPAGCMWLDDYLDECLFINDFPDLLRGLLLVNGSFPGSVRANFTQPWPGKI